MKKQLAALCILISFAAGLALGYVLPHNNTPTPDGEALPFTAEDLAAHEDVLVWAKSTGTDAAPVGNDELKQKLIDLCMKAEPYRPYTLSEVSAEKYLRLYTGDPDGLHEFVEITLFDVLEQQDLENPNRDTPLVLISVGGWRAAEDPPYDQLGYRSFCVDWDWLCALSPAEFLELDKLVSACHVETLTYE